MTGNNNATASFRIDEANLEDAADIAALLGQLGYPQSVAAVTEKLQALQKSESDLVLVASLGGTVAGFVHLHTAELFHQRGQLGRVMALSVAADQRRRGIGQRLMQAVEERAKDMGCVEIEVTSGVRRAEAHQFYRRLGYGEEPKRFIKELK